jgi:hypothetical protein
MFAKNRMQVQTMEDRMCLTNIRILSANPKILVYTALRRDSDQEQSG